MNQKYIEIKVNKPLYGTYFNLWDKYIDDAKRLKVPIMFTLQYGRAIYTPAEWLKGAKRVEQIFKRPDEPMVMWGKEIEIGHLPKLTGKAKKVAEAYEKYNSLSEEEKFIFNNQH